MQRKPRCINIPKRAEAVIAVAGWLQENRNWEKLPPKLFDRYLEGMGNILTDFPLTGAQSGAITGLLRSLKSEQARTAAQDITGEPAPAESGRKPGPQAKTEKFKP